MKIKIQDKEKWHKKFAWAPIIIEGYLIWLESYERKRVLLGFFPLEYYQEFKTTKLTPYELVAFRDHEGKPWHTAKWAYKVKLIK